LTKKKKAEEAKTRDHVTTWSDSSALVADLNGVTRSIVAHVNTLFYVDTRELQPEFNAILIFNIPPAFVNDSQRILHRINWNRKRTEFYDGSSQC